MKTISLTSLLLAQLLFFVTANDGKNFQRVLKKQKKKSKIKSKKKGKKGKAVPAIPPIGSLSALVTKAPRYEGSMNPFGTSFLRCNSDGSFLFHISATGLDPSCTKCKIAIMDATSCSTELSEPFYSTNMESDPWNAGGENYYYTFTPSGISSSAFTFSNGYSCEENLGKTVGVYDTNDEMIGCGELGIQPNTNVLKAEIGSYPGYEGDLSPEGTVTVSFFADDTFSFDYDVTGLRANVEGAGIHIHAGLSCDTHEEVLGHGWNTEVVRDLWTSTGGAVYSTDGLGTADGMFHLYNGFTIEGNFHHALVIHDADGKRVGCGVLMYA